MQSALIIWAYKRVLSAILQTELYRIKRCLVIKIKLFVIDKKKIIFHLHRKWKDRAYVFILQIIYSILIIDAAIKMDEFYFS